MSETKRPVSETKRVRVQYWLSPVLLSALDVWRAELNESGSVLPMTEAELVGRVLFWATQVRPDVFGIPRPIPPVNASSHLVATPTPSATTAHVPKAPRVPVSGDPSTWECRKNLGPRHNGKKDEFIGEDLFKKTTQEEGEED